MTILGHGIDIVETSRIARMMDDHADRFMLRVFTEAERSYSADRRRMIEHLAGRFAAKEAVLKALGTGWGRGILWTDVEVVRQDSGQPTVLLHGRCLEVATEQGVTRWMLSISHISTHATASAIAIGQ